MDNLNKVIDFFPEYIKKLYQSNRLHLSASHVLVLSIRPKLNFNQPIIINSDYNFEADEIKAQSPNHDLNNISKKFLNRKQRNSLKKKNIDNYKEAIIKLTNYYDILDSMDSKISECNEESDSNLTIQICVDKITGIKKHRKHIEKVNFNQIIDDYDRLIMKELEDSKEETPILRRSNIIETRVNEILESYPLQHEIIVHRPSNICKSTESQTTHTGEMSNLDIEKLIDVINNSQLESLDSRDRNVLRRKIQYNLTNIIVSEFKELSRDWKRVSDEVNPENESIMMGLIANQIPAETRPILDRIIKPLIVKASRASQAFMISAKQVSRVIRNINSSIVGTIFDLD